MRELILHCPSIELVDIFLKQIIKKKFIKINTYILTVFHIYVYEKQLKLLKHIYEKHLKLLKKKNTFL